MINNFERVPHNIEVEQALLGAILLRNELLDSILGEIQPESFYDPLHGRIFEVCLKLADSGRSLSPITLSPYFENEDPIAGMTISQYLGRLVANTTGFNVQDYADLITELSIARSAIVHAEDLISEMQSGDIDIKPTAALEGALDRFFKLSNKTSTRKLQNAGDVGRDIVTELAGQNTSNFIPTGLHGLNKIINGYYPGECIYIGGRPGMGKSSFAQSEFLKAGKAGHGAVLFSLEMNAKEVTQRLLSDMVYQQKNEIPYSVIRQGNFDAYQRERLTRAYKEMQEMGLEIYDKRGITIGEIAAQCRQVARKFKKRGKTLDIIFIDYLGKIKVSDRYRGNKVYELGEISNELTIIAGEFNIPIVILHQLNRDVESREDKRPTIADFRSSGDIEQDAHVILFPFRPVYYLQQDLDNPNCARDHGDILAQIEACKEDMFINVAKQRNGPCGTTKVRASMGSNAIRNII